MRIVIQRVKEASVTIDANTYSSIKNGILALVGFSNDDTKDVISPMADKMLGLRIFEDENQKMNLSLKDIGGEVLIVSQFTLYADCKKGRRPSFQDAKNPDDANRLYEDFVSYVKSLGFDAKTGVFGEDMKVNLLNDGPVTIILDSDIIIK